MQPRQAEVTMSMKNDFIAPIVILTLICLVISGSLAYVDTFTRPKIEADAAMRARQEMEKIIPEARDFIEVTNLANIPGTVSGIFAGKDGNGKIAGYIFMVASSGYGGKINIICGIDNNGKILRTSVMSHTETKGISDPVFAAPVSGQQTYQGQYIGKDKNLDGVVAVSGATVSSTAYKRGIEGALSAFDIVTKGEKQ